MNPIVVAGHHWRITGITHCPDMTGREKVVVSVQRMSDQARACFISDTVPADTVLPVLPDRSIEFSPLKKRRPEPVTTARIAA